MSFPTGFIARGGFFQPHEASRLQSFREPQSIPRAWAHAAPRYRQSDNFTNQIATLRRQVNGAQQHALALARDFETGGSKVALHEVMLSMQKANIAFQATVQARNRLVTAYQDIMNMPI